MTTATTTAASPPPPPNQLDTTDSKSVLSQTDARHYLRVLQHEQEEVARMEAELLALEERLRLSREVVEVLGSRVGYPQVQEPAPAPARNAMSRGPVTANSPLSASRPYRGLTLLEAATTYLEYSGDWTDTKTLARMIRNGGYQSKSKDLYANVYKALYEELKRGAESAVGKAGHLWGLKGWEAPNTASKAA